MRKVLNFVNDNKKIIIVVILIIVLVGTIYLMNPKKTEDAASVTQMTQTEAKLTAILSSIDGVGETEVMINEGEEGILGVVIVCGGADNIMTRNVILNAVSTALSVDKKIIAIYSKNN